MGGINYKKLFLDEMFVSGLREENGRVYERYWDDVPEVLIFDFNLQPGDIIKDDFQDQVQMEVKQVREVDVEGKSRRCMDMWAYMEGIEIVEGLVDYWLEGIGCMNGPHYPFWWDAIGRSSLLLSCYDGDECIFTSEDINQITKIQSAITNYAPGNRQEIYDMQGRKVLMPQKNCLYIINGRKFIMNEELSRRKK